MFPGFETFDLATAASVVHGHRGGDGPPVLLLHGIPETHLMWHRVAPRLAERHTVVATDLRGYGASGTPPSTDEHRPYAMREIGREQVEVMQELGFERFAVVGHDRGARCAYRMALDHPDVVTRLAVLDIVPTGDAFGRADARFSLGYWVWSFLAAPEPVPERMILGAPAVFVDHMLDAWSDADADAGDGGVFPAEVRAAYVDQFRDPATVHAICEEYRAAATLDLEHDVADRVAGRRIGCPTLALWSSTGAVAAWYDPLEVWKGWADDLRGAAVGCGHFLPEEAPDDVTRHLLDLLAGW
ncbi:MAG TPA: alpha/beta hydrolase [Acidimicrobiales bacterium]|nr:alpha/beta hydrolase [Acidimicrobiales bacterium]